MPSMASPLGVKASHLTPFLWGSQGAGSGAHHRQQRLLTSQKACAVSPEGQEQVPGEERRENRRENWEPTKRKEKGKGAG